MKHQTNAPKFCLFLLLCLFSYSAVTAKAENKSKERIAQSSLLSSVSNFTSITAMALPIKAAPKASVVSQKSEANTTGSLFLKGTFYGAISIILLLNMISFFLFEEKVFGYFGLAVTGTLILFLGEDNLSGLLFQQTLFKGTGVTTTILCATAGLVALYSSQYLTIKEYFPKLKTFTVPLFLVAAGLSVTHWFVDNAMLPVAVNIISFTLLTCYFGGGIMLFLKNNYSKFYVLGMAIPLLLVLDYFVLQVIGINFLNVSLTAVKASFFINVLLMTYAILFRMKDIKEETAARKTEMEIFLNKEKMMERDNIIKLTEEMYLENLIMQYDLDGLEIKLLQYISEGKENKKIAKKLNTSEIEIEEMTRSLYNKIQIEEAVQEDVNLLNLQPDFLYN
ncbi:7TM-DISM domain-containing protein [Flavobacteriaceae bacterium]|nr:7TM-DISM domain-containing protein [Flavobacteriaceae bacterium]